ncbi:ESX secretion-associated protein EspG [Nocardia sp. NPDC019395]|uniref:ESX secretion-associated protein EspG n=1 Tax=Nocardia sp. NPDC019395 TaxID=3154686 RepID=UPI0033D9E0AB
MPEWTWDTEDFAALWYSEAHDRFPRPLKYLSRFATENDFAAHRSAVRARCSGDELERIGLALHTLSTSEYRIEILGGRSDPATGLAEYRIVGARNHRYALTLAQRCRGDDHGPVHCRLVRAESLPRALTSAIPAHPAGTRPTETFHPGDLEPAPGHHLQDNSHNSPRERYRRLLRRPSLGGGSAGLRIGPLYARPDATRTIQWYDIADDGRYTETRGRHITVRPAGPNDLTTRFTAWLDDADRRLQEV